MLCKKEIRTLNGQSKAEPVHSLLFVKSIPTIRFEDSRPARANASVTCEEYQSIEMSFMLKYLVSIKFCTMNCSRPAQDYYSYHLSLNTSSPASFLSQGPEFHHSLELEVQTDTVALVDYMATPDNCNYSTAVS